MIYNKMLENCPGTPLGPVYPRYIDPELFSRTDLPRVSVSYGNTIGPTYPR